MPLIKTLSQTLKQDKEKFKVPKSVQQAIPIRKIWPDGIFQVESKYSRTFRFTDINYSIASKADKSWMQSRGYRSSGTFSRQTFHRVFHLT